MAGPGVATFNLAGDPSPPGNPMAAGDLVAVRETDGVTRLYVVQTFVGLALTLTTNLVAGVTFGSKVYNFGVETDTDPVTGAPHEVYDLAAASTTTYYSDIHIIGTHLPDEPLLLSIDNVTNQGAIDWAVWVVGQTPAAFVSSSDPGALFPL